MPTLCAHLGYLFNEMPLERRFEAARAAGFTAVEHPSPYSIPARRVARLCRDNGLTFVQMALPAGEPERGEKGLACLPGREREFRESVKVGIAYASESDARYIHPMAGVLPWGVARAEAWSTYIENIGIACDRAAAAKIPVLVEAIGVGTIANYFIDIPDLALRAIAELGRPNLRLLFDTFHASNAGLDPSAFMSEHHGLVAHVHVADAPDRHEPGTGTIDFRLFFDTLKRVNFGGAIGLEYIPASSTLAGLAWRNTFSLG